MNETSKNFTVKSKILALLKKMISKDLLILCFVVLSTETLLYLQLNKKPNVVTGHVAL
jgi:hypothetical protein